MSIQALNWALSQVQITSSPARFVLVVLCNYADKNGRCWPSIEKLAKNTALSTRSVQRHLNWLVDNKYISRQHRRYKDTKSTNMYQIVGINTTPDHGDRVTLGSVDLSDRECEKHCDILSPNTKESKELTKEEEKKNVVLSIFQNWSEVLGHQNAICDKKRYDRITARLQDGFTPDQLLLVPHGVLKSPYHLGDNVTKTKYDGISTVFRDAEQVEKFIALARNGNRSRGCNICLTHPHAHEITIKGGGYIFDPETNSVTLCKCYGAA